METSADAFAAYSGIVITGGRALLLVLDGPPEQAFTVATVL